MEGDNSYRDYIKLSKKDKKELQHLVWFDFLDMYDDEMSVGNKHMTLKLLLNLDLEFFVKREEYEAAQLISDILKNYKIEIENFD